MTDKTPPDINAGRSAPDGPAADSPTTFTAFGLAPDVLKGVEAAGFQQPSPIQAAAIPVILAGRDVVGQAQTGTGKTAAFGLPAMSMLEHGGFVEVLVIVPTRELAKQISDELFRLGKLAGVRTLAIYGGQSYGLQLKRLAHGPQIVVATPGRLLDLLRSNRMGDFAPRMVVLDEADEMLDMGFLEDIEAIFEFLPAERQTLLFSATMPKPIERLAQKLLKSPKTVSVGGGQVTAENVQQQYFVINEHERDDAILRLIDGHEPDKAIIFCRTRAEVDRLSDHLAAQGFLAEGLHGDMDQRQRERTIGRFRGGDVHLLVATDVAARGLDVADITHVFNYHIPFDADSYVHRIGRTGRAGKSGLALTLVTPREFRGIQKIQAHVGEFIAREMPTASYVRRTAAAKLADAIAVTEADPVAESLLESLAETLSADEVARRALSLLLATDEREGPELIGLSHKEIKRLKQTAKTHGGKGRRKPGGYGGPGGKRGPGGPGGKRRGPKKPHRKGPSGKGGRRGG